MLYPSPRTTTKGGRALERRQGKRRQRRRRHRSLPARVRFHCPLPASVCFVCHLIHSPASCVSIHWHVQATRAYRLGALDDARAMDWLRGRVSEAFAARFCVASCGLEVVERVQDPRQTDSITGTYPRPPRRSFTPLQPSMCAHAGAHAGLTVRSEGFASRRPLSPTSERARGESRVRVWCTRPGDRC